MSYQLEEINRGVREDPEGLVRAGNEAYEERLQQAAGQIYANMEKCPIVFLSGPSGSGKTTTAQKLGETLSRRGVRTHSISLDNYFTTLDPATAPRDENGEIDLESPLCLDAELLDDHFERLTRGEEIHVPQYVFSEQKRSDTVFTPVRLQENEIAIFEGIHALNSLVSGGHPDAFCLFIGTESRVYDGDKVVFRKTWFRLLRRLARDTTFRGTSPETTLALWDNVARGEKKYILPFTYRADLSLDTSFIYEIPVMKRKIERLCADVKPETENYGLIVRILEALKSFEALDEHYIPEDAMLREFIGGGKYAY